MLLAVHFHTKYSAKLDKPCEGFTRGAVHRLSQHDWPGNVRELEHVIERAVTLATGPRLDAADLQMPRVHSKLHAFQKLKAQTIKAFEFKYLDELLKSSRGNITHAAKSARIDVRVLRRMIRQYRMQVRRYTPR
jgi:DNA-binding NtrC family response regulator